MPQAFDIAGDTNSTLFVTVAPLLVERVVERLVVKGAIRLQKVAKTLERVTGSTQERLRQPQKGQQITVVRLQMPLW